MVLLSGCHVVPHPPCSFKCVTEICDLIDLYTDQEWLS